MRRARALWRSLGRWTSAVAVAVVVLGVLASAAAGGYTDRMGQRESQATLDRRTARTAEALQSEIARYQDTVTLLAASLSAQEDFNAADFDAITAPLGQARLAGASGATFVAPAGPEQVGEVSSFWQARGSGPLQPRGDGEHYLIIFSRTLDDATSSSQGRDLAEAAQPARALRQARLSGAAAVSDTYPFLRDQDLPVDQRQPAIVITAPVYGAPGTADAGRFRGWALMGMRTGDAAETVLTDAGRGATNTTLSITDSTGVPARAMQVVGGPEAPGGRSSEAEFGLGDQRWQVSATSTVAGDEVAASYTRLAQVITVGGIALSALLGGICWLLATRRRRALAQVAAATAELRATGAHLAEAEAAARDQAGLLRAVVDSIGDGVGVVDAQGRFLLHNRAAEDLVVAGEDLGASQGWQDHETYLPDARTPFPPEELPLARAMAGHSVDEVDVVVRDAARPEGVVITVSARPLDAAAGVPGGAVAIFRDVTARRRDEQALARSEAAYALAFEGSMIGMSVTDLHGVFLRVNRAFADIVGCTAEDLVGTSAFDLDHPDDDRASVHRLNAEVLDGQREGFALRRRFVRADGAVGHAELSCVLVRGTDGAALHFTNQVVDVTDQVAAETELDARQQLLRAVMDNSQSLIAVKDLHRRYLLANAPLQAAAGRSEGEIIGQLESEVFPRVAAVRQGRDLAARSGVRYEEDAISDPDGAQTIYETVRFPLFDAAGALYATCSISTDVTAKRDAAAQRDAAAAAVAAAAAAAAEAKTAFLATMSHEIRTPLNGVLGLLTLLQGTDLDAGQQAWAHGAATSGRALLAIVNDVLDASKIAAGAVVLESIELDLLDVVDEALTPLREAAADKDVHLVTAPARGLNASRIGDPTRLRQVITNLASNAVKFTDQGTVTVKVAASDRRVQVVVADTGIGMSEAARERLFTPYAQGEASTTRAFGGTGLGMSIVSGIVTAMNGTIAVTSTPGVGTTFEVDLPMLALTSPRTPRAAAHQPGGAQPRRPGPVLRVLVAEDNEINQIVARATLEKHAMVVDVVADGAAAVEAVARGGYDAVFMDCQMPRVDGLEATRRIRSAQRARTGQRRIPIVAMTAGAFDADRAACTDAGMDAFLPKPWTADQLAQALAVVRAAAGAGAAARDEPPPQPEAASQLSSVHARLDELFEGDDPAAAAPMRRRLVHSFLVRTPPLLAELGEAAAHHDEQSVVAIAHTLRGLAGNLGATTLAHLAATLDEGLAAPEPSTVDVDRLVAALGAAFDHLAAGLTPLDAG